MENLDKTLDKMVDHLVAYDEIPFLDLVQFVWRRDWRLCLAAKPNDTAPLRLALKACLIERMVEIWNAPPKNSNETVPVWFKEVPAVKEHFSVISPGERDIWQNEISSPVFEKRNIFAPAQFMFFL
jgi:hypothetical protein